MNSFRFLERGIAAELERQAKLLDGGGVVEQETLHYDPADGSITSLRSKEYAHDYRYIPEPDLDPLEPTEEMIAAARKLVGELPDSASPRYAASSGCRRPRLARIRHGARHRVRGFVGDEEGRRPRVAANWILNDVTAAAQAASNPEVEVPAEHRHLLHAIAAKELSHQSARQVLDELLSWAGIPPGVAERLGVSGGTDSSELEAIVEQALAEQADAAEKVRAGKDGAIGPIVGAVMRATQGRADGGEVTRLIKEKLSPVSATDGPGRRPEAPR